MWWWFVLVCCVSAQVTSLSDSIKVENGNSDLSPRIDKPTGLESDKSVHDKLEVEQDKRDETDESEPEDEIGQRFLKIDVQTNRRGYNNNVKRKLPDTIFTSHTPGISMSRTTGSVSPGAKITAGFSSLLSSMFNPKIVVNKEVIPNGLIWRKYVGNNVGVSPLMLQLMQKYNLTLPEWKILMEQLGKIKGVKQNASTLLAGPAEVQYWDNLIQSWFANGNKITLTKKREFPSWGSTNQQVLKTTNLQGQVSPNYYYYQGPNGQLQFYQPGDITGFGNNGFTQKNMMKYMINPGFTDVDNIKIKGLSGLGYNIGNPQTDIKSVKQPLVGTDKGQIKMFPINDGQFTNKGSTFIPRPGFTFFPNVVNDNRATIPLDYSTLNVNPGMVMSSVPINPSIDGFTVHQPGQITITKSPGFTKMFPSTQQITGTGGNSIEPAAPTGPNDNSNNNNSPSSSFVNISIHTMPTTNNFTNKGPGKIVTDDPVKLPNNEEPTSEMKSNNPSLTIEIPSNSFSNSNASTNPITISIPTAADKMTSDSVPSLNTNSFDKGASIIIQNPVSDMPKNNVEDGGRQPNWVQDQAQIIVENMPNPIPASTEPGLTIYNTPTNSHPNIGTPAPVEIPQTMISVQPSEFVVQPIPNQQNILIQKPQMQSPQPVVTINPGTFEYPSGVYINPNIKNVQNPSQFIIETRPGVTVEKSYLLNKNPQNQGVKVQPPSKVDYGPSSVHFVNIPPTFSGNNLMEPAIFNTLPKQLDIEKLRGVPNFSNIPLHDIYTPLNMWNEGPYPAKTNKTPKPGQIHHKPAIHNVEKPNEFVTNYRPVNPSVGLPLVPQDNESSNMKPFDMFLNIQTGPSDNKKVPANIGDVPGTPAQPDYHTNVPNIQTDSSEPLKYVLNIPSEQHASPTIYSKKMIHPDFSDLNNYFPTPVLNNNYDDNMKNKPSYPTVTAYPDGRVIVPTYALIGKKYAHVPEAENPVNYKIIDGKFVPIPGQYFTLYNPKLAKSDLLKNPSGSNFPLEWNSNLYFPDENRPKNAGASKVYQFGQGNVFLPHINEDIQGFNNYGPNEVTGPGVNELPYSTFIGKTNMVKPDVHWSFDNMPKQNAVRGIKTLLSDMQHASFPNFNNLLLNGFVENTGKKPSYNRQGAFNMFSPQMFYQHLSPALNGKAMSLVNKPELDYLQLTQTGGKNAQQLFPQLSIQNSNQGQLGQTSFSIPGYDNRLSTQGGAINSQNVYWQQLMKQIQESNPQQQMFNLNHYGQLNPDRQTLAKTI